MVLLDFNSYRASLVKSSALRRVPFETCLEELQRHGTGRSLCRVVYGHFFSFQNGNTKLKCKQGRQLIPTVLLYERCEVALVFYALGNVNRTSGLRSGHTFLHSGFIIRVDLNTAN